MEITYQLTLDKNYTKAVKKISRDIYKHNKFRKIMRIGDFLLYLFCLIPSLFIAFYIMNWAEVLYDYYENILAYYAGYILFVISMLSFFYALIIRPYLNMCMIKNQIGDKMEKGSQTIRIQEDGLYNLNTRRLDYLRKIKRKTAILIAFATVSGSIISGAKKEDVDSSYRFGYYLGMSYQIIDDYLDFAGGATSLGKEIGQDLVNGNITLPALIAKEKNENLFLDFNRSINLEKKNVIIDYIKNNKDILDETLSISQRYLDKAENSIAEINEEVNKELIFIMNRLARREY